MASDASPTSFASNNFADVFRGKRATWPAFVKILVRQHIVRNEIHEVRMMPVILPLLFEQCGWASSGNPIWDRAMEHKFGDMAKRILADMQNQRHTRRWVAMPAQNPEAGAYRWADWVRTWTMVGWNGDTSEEAGRRALANIDSNERMHPLPVDTAWVYPPAASPPQLMSVAVPLSTICGPRGREGEKQEAQHEDHANEEAEEEQGRAESEAGAVLPPSTPISQPQLPSTPCASRLSPTNDLSISGLDNPAPGWGESFISQESPSVGRDRRRRRRRRRKQQQPPSSQESGSQQPPSSQESGSQQHPTEEELQPRRDPLPTPKERGQPTMRHGLATPPETRPSHHRRDKRRSCQQQTCLLDEIEPQAHGNLQHDFPPLRPETLPGAGQVGTDGEAQQPQEQGAAGLGGERAAEAGPSRSRSVPGGWLSDASIPASAPPQSAKDGKGKPAKAPPDVYAAPAPPLRIAERMSWLALQQYSSTMWDGKRKERREAAKVMIFEHWQWLESWYKEQSSVAKQY
ncbi:hypothetical protein MKZ38_006184 [Zalerion maritima]|uniref:Uncharacterized protein n=1 Tax=Zalerion maritima TaxID=339359 RepID=A0AAD5WPT1_9PEZI|nr:hypothetical protein MKZ38_006184 [Zalerion maritima]